MMRTLFLFFRQWRYLYLLGSLLGLLVVEPIATSFRVMESLFDALFVFVMAVLVLALAQDKVWRVIACIFCVASAALLFGGQFLTATAQDASSVTGHTIGALFFVVIAGKIVASIFASQELSWDTVFGAICGYLLLGVAFGLTYATIHTVNPESFQFGDAIRPHLEQRDFSRDIFIYFSFVTLATVGYGDVTPLSIPARTLSWVEAITGQLYLAVLIAGLISALVTSNAAAKRRQ